MEPPHNFAQHWDGKHRTALYAAELCSQSTRNNNPMAEMDGARARISKKVAFLALEISLLHTVGMGCNEAKLNDVSELLNPHLSFTRGQKGNDKKKERQR